MSERQSEGLVSMALYDRASGTVKDRFGLRPDEILAILALPALYWGLFKYLGFGIGPLQWDWRVAFLIFALGAVYARDTPHYSTPVVYVSGFLRFVYVYIIRGRGRLLGESAAKFSNVEDITEIPLDPDRDVIRSEKTYDPSVSGAPNKQTKVGVLELDDGSKAGIVKVLDLKTTVADYGDYIQAAATFADAFSDLVAANDSGLSFYVDVETPDGEATDDLRDCIAEAESIGAQEAFADQFAEAIEGEINSSGDMDEGSYIVARTTPGEVAQSQFKKTSDWFQETLGIGRPDAGADSGASARGHDVDPQERALCNRLQSALTLARRVGEESSEGDDGAGLPRVLDGDEAGDVLRHWWDRSQTAGDGIDVTGMAMTGQELARSPEIQAARERGEGVGEGEDRDEDSKSGKSDPDIPRATLWGPEDVTEHRKSIEVDGEWRSTLMLVGGSESPEVGVLAELREIEGVKMTLAMHTQSPNRLSMAEKLEGFANRLKSSRQAAAAESDDVRAEDAEGRRGMILAIRNMLLGNGDYEEQQPVEAAIYITVRAETKQRLEEQVADVKERARSSGIGLKFRVAQGRQEHGLLATAPTGEDKLNPSLRVKTVEFIRETLDVNLAVGVNTRLLMPEDTLGCFLPFTGGVREDDNGVIFGMAQAVHPSIRRLRPAGILRLSRERTGTPHRYFLGQTGSGKTFLVTVLLITELLLSKLPGRQGKRAIIIDIAENFEGVVKLFGGQKVTPGETTLNPWAVHPDGLPIQQIVNLVADIQDIYLRDNASPEFADDVDSISQRLVRATFTEAGIEDLSDAHKPSPTYESFFDLLARLSEDDENLPDGVVGGDRLAKQISLRETEHEADDYRTYAGKLLTKMGPFADGNEYEFLVADPDDPEERESGIDPNAKVVLFDMHHFQDRDSAAKQIAARAIMSVGFRWSKLLPEEVLTVVDEAHDILRSDQASRFETLVLAGRNAGMHFDFMTQTDDHFDADSAAVIESQCGLSAALNMGDRKNAAKVASVLGISEYAAEMVCGGLERGRSEEEDYSEVMVSRGDETYRVRVVVGEFVARIVEYTESEHGAWEPYLHRAVEAARSGTGGEGADDDPKDSDVPEQSPAPEASASEQGQSQGQAQEQTQEVAD